MSISNDPVHVADRHLEKLQALARIIRVTADSAPDEDWRDLRLGIQTLSGEIEQLVTDAREILDDA